MMTIGNWCIKIFSGTNETAFYVGVFPTLEPALDVAK